MLKKLANIAGMSLMETLIASAILSTMIGVALYFSAHIQKMVKSETTKASLDTALENTMERIAQELRNSKRTLIVVDSANHSVQFDTCTVNPATQAITVNNDPSLFQIQDDPNDSSVGGALNVDNDKDGVVDQKNLVLIRHATTVNPSTVVLAKNIELQPTVSVFENPDHALGVLYRINVKLTLAKRDPVSRKILRSTLERSIFINSN